MSHETARVGGHVSDLDLDRRAAGTDTAERRAEVDTHLRLCISCAGRWRAIQDEQAAFQARPLPSFLDPASPAAAEPATVRRLPTRPKWLAPTFAVLALAAVALLIARPTTTTTPLDPDGTTPDDIRTKGSGSTLLMSVVEPATHPSPGHPPGKARLLAPDGETLHPGDVLQWRVNLRAPRFVAILSRDATHTVSTYFPVKGAMPRVEAGDARPLGAEVELDATLGPETIWALFCEAPTDLAPLSQALAAQGDAVHAPPGCTAQRVHITKTARP